MLRLQILEITKDDQFQGKYYHTTYLYFLKIIISRKKIIILYFFREIKNLESNLEIGEAE